MGRFGTERDRFDHITHVLGSQPDQMTGSATHHSHSWRARQYVPASSGTAYTASTIPGSCMPRQNCPSMSIGDRRQSIVQISRLSQIDH